MPPPQQLSFSEEELQQLFGHEAAEDEKPQRLREYYFKTSIYDQIANDLPLRIIVGHKGIGKSALFQVAIAEEQENNRITTLIRPDDVIGLGTNTTDFLQIIREWKIGLSEIIARKVLETIGISSEDLQAKLKRYAGAILNFLGDTFKDMLKEKKGISTIPAKKAIVDCFLKSRRMSVYIDDLDRGWQGRKEDIIRISALLNAVRDISTESRGISFRVSLRSDVYYLVRTSDESTLSQRMFTTRCIAPLARYD